MTMGAGDLGVLGNLAKALGIFDKDGDPNPDWFGDPGDSLKTMLADPDQRNALIAFVDDAMGGADRTTDPSGVVWLPIVHIDDPDLTVSITVAEKPDGIHIGIALLVRTTGPTSTSSLSVPLFRTKKNGGPSVSNPLLLGSAGGRIRLSTAITIDGNAPVPGEARIGAIGIDVDLPTALSGDPVDPVFGLSLTGFQLPGATSPRDIRVAADGLDELDDALLDLVLSLVKSAADTAAPNSVIAAVGGLLGLKSGDAIPDFPITTLPTQGVQAIANWLHGLITNTDSRNAWLGYVARLFGVAPPAPGAPVSFSLGGGAALEVNLRVDTGPSGNPRLTPTLGLKLGNATARVEARADLFDVDLVTGAARALPQFGVWAAAGTAASRVLDVAGPPIARADTLRIGFALDAQRRLTFVLAADNVVLGAHTYPTLDLTSPDAVMDAVGNTVSDVAAQLLGNLGGVLPTVRLLIGLDAPPGITAITLPALMTNPVDAISGYWHALFSAAGTAVTTVLSELRNALADAGSAASAILGTGNPVDPWRVPLLGVLGLEFSSDGTELTIGLAVGTSIDTLGQRCTVIDTRIAATLAVINLETKSASLLPGVEGVLSARERGVNPPRVTLQLGSGTSLTASGVGLRLGWTPAGGLSAGVSAPNLQLVTGDLSVPIAMPEIAADGTVTLPPAAWDGVEALVSYLGELVGGFVGNITSVLGWSNDVLPTGHARLRLSDLVNDPEMALRDWLPRLAMSELGPEALTMLADLFGGSGPNRGYIEGTGHPDDPYRLALAPELPNLAVWFPPAGLEARQVAAPEALRRWRPGDAGLSASALAAGLAAEATVAADVRDLIADRDVAGGLAAMVQRWVGGDGRIVPPPSTPTGVTVSRVGFAAGQLHGQLNLPQLIGRTPTTTVRVAIGASAWPDAPANRRVDLSTPHLDASMFAAPAAATGEWFVALGSRADCLVTGSITDGTPEQAARLARVLDALGNVSNDIALVAVAGAGHAARLAAQAQTKVTDLVTLGTPLSPIALTALFTQPTADALRLLHRLLPTTGSGEDPDLSLGRALVGSMMELVALPDASADLRPPAVVPVPPRAGLAVKAVFGAVTEAQVARAMTAIVAAGLSERARVRANTPLPDATGVKAGLRLVLAPTNSGSLRIQGSALLTLFSFDESAGIDTARHLRVQLRVGDRTGWLSATPDLELRSVSADISLPLDGTSSGNATVTLHDARVFGQSWERLVLGTGPGAVPLMPEARVLLAAALQRISADIGIASLALDELLTALGIVDPAGGLAGDALDQLLHDAGGLLRQRMAAAGSDVSEAIAVLLGPLGTSVDLATRSVHVVGGGNASGRFGWHADITASPTGIAGELRLGADHALPGGNLSLLLALNPLNVSFQWHQAGGSIDTVAIWPIPDPAAIGRAIARSAPSIGGHAALELMRRADDTVRPLIDAALDALGLLNGTIGDAQRTIRPIAGLLADPAGYLRSSISLGANPAKIQSLFDALRPLLGAPGAAGTPLALGSGVSFSVTAAGPGARLALDVDATAWTAPNGVAGRLAAGAGASLTLGPTGAPSLGLELHVGISGAATPGRQAIYARIGASGLELFVRPAVGNDISLVPFAGLGSLAAAAEAALPFLLDKLAEINGTVGQLVGTVGDAFGLRSGVPRKFQATALHDWAINPVGKLEQSVPTIVATGLTTLAPLLDAFLPATVNATANANTLTVSVGAFGLAWSPATGVVSLTGNNVAVPGIEHVSFTLSLAATGIEELSITAGPASINAGGVELRPFVTVAVGKALELAHTRRVAIGMTVDATHRFAVRWLLDTHQFAIVATDGPMIGGVDTLDPGAVALRVVEVVADLVAGVAMAQPAVAQLLDTQVTPSTTVRKLMRGVVLQDVANPTQLITGMFDPDSLLPRVHKLFGNIADAQFAITMGDFKLSFTRDEDLTIGLQLGLKDRFELISGDVMLWLENDATWITNNGNPNGNKGGLFVGFLPSTLPLRFTPTLAVNGVGLRIGKSSGPLLDFGITLESIALHAYAKITSSGPPSGGVQLQFSNLAVSAGGAKGDNGIAQGVMKDTGPTPPKPAFSPAIAIQKHGSGDVQVSLRAGDGDGPWWIAIQKGFGPLYLEQIGFGATMPNGKLERVSLLMDGSVSMFGLTCTVDDLQITYITANGDFFNPNNWAIDLAGLAVSANMAGVSIAGGLLKQQTPAGIEYLGMLLGRFGVYGITIYGGYGEGKVPGTEEKFTAFFAVGAVNGPIGGPPAFFLTGIGGGFGINRKLIVPTDLSRFGDYPLIQALDIAAQPQDPMTQLRKLGEYFPMQKGTFWFAAGISFNSFALVDGIAVLAVEIGDGLDINLLGLARMALPRPQAALVSIELALLVHFSSSEGVLWVQGQLTDNSWLLYPDIKLTGGFAYVMWWKGEHKGEFVITLGGYHPDFHRDGYPVVPRLGLRWTIGDYIVIKAESYFALTSEALMAGGAFEASATFGPAWAEVKFGANGIVYFDPFHYDVDAYARIAAGITIDTWIFGEITISISLGARIEVTGPDFHGKATFEVGPVELTVEFGGSDHAQKQPLPAPDFIAKYLEAGGSGGAKAHALITAFGALPAKGEDSTPDGSEARPFVVVVEFGMTFTSTVPAGKVQRTQGSLTTHTPSRTLGVAAMFESNINANTIVLTWTRNGATQPFPFVATARPFGAFPVGIWGPAQDANNRKVPKAEMVEALNELDLVCVATESPGGPEIPYYQVEIGKRKPLPFSRRAADVSTLKSQAQAVAGLITAPITVAAAFQDAKKFLTASPTAAASLRGERQSPPLLGTLTEGLMIDPSTVVPGVGTGPVQKVYDHFIDAPIAVGFMSGATVDLRVASPTRTTVKGSAKAWRVAPPTMAKVEASRSKSIAARLVMAEPQAVRTDQTGNTVIGAVSVPLTAVAHAAPVVVARSGAASGMLGSFTAALAAGKRIATPSGVARAAAPAAVGAVADAVLMPGQTVVLKMPNAHADADIDAPRPRITISGAPVRMVLLGHGGTLMADQLVGPDVTGKPGSIGIPAGTERIVAIGQSDQANAAIDAGLAGWHAGLRMPYCGWSSAVAPGCVVRANGETIKLHRERLDAGWINGAELARGVSTVATTFSEALRTVVIVLDDPAAFGDTIDARQLLMGLDGAARVQDALGNDVPPVLLSMENRSVLAYDIVPDGRKPVMVTIATQTGWSLVGVMGSAKLDATGAVSTISSRGLDAAIRPFAAAPANPQASRLAWNGPVRNDAQRHVARAMARGRPLVAATGSDKPIRRKKGGHR
ncbi:DUF6603 domain-containing protein [Variovorax rhizosphaerae]|uniref:DUF6603 domain-containing protein n=1 Tax=Variovorax rhizosphaerae TaxID=1836200 RepID=A0ABU8WP55_9BURK